MIYDIQSLMRVQSFLLLILLVVFSDILLRRCETDLFGLNEFVKRGKHFMSSSGLF